jgi:EmrB/QacA subfamily drug resistance transporter
MPTAALAVPPAPAVLRTASPNLILAIVCVGIVLANLDLFIVNVALPDIGADFKGAGLEKLSWILNGYAIVYAALLVFFGRLSERYRRDRSFLLSVALFTAASAACAAATSVETLIAFRVVQAVGAALMTPTSLGLVLATFPPEKRGHAVRTWTAIGGFAAALGPLAGGLLVAVNWRWIFLVNVPIGLLALAVGALKLPAVSGHDVKRPRVRGALLVTLGIAALTFGIVKTSDWGWASPGVAAALTLAALFLALFVIDCLRSDNPFVDPGLFRIGPFAGANLIMAPYSIAFGSMLFSLALWMQIGWGWSAMKTGIAIAPGPFMVPVTSLIFGGRLIARYGVVKVITAGVLLFVAGFVWWAAGATLEPNLAFAMIGLVIIGIGVGLTFPSLMGAGTAALPPASFATGSGVLNMTRQTALAVGVALFVAIVSGPHTAAGRLTAFEHGWWIMAAVTLLGLPPLLLMVTAKTRKA